MATAKLLILILTLLLLSVTSMASAQWVTTQSTSNTSCEDGSQINDSGQVVWNGGGSDGGTNLEIFYCDGNTVIQPRVAKDDIGWRQKIGGYCP